MVKKNIKSEITLVHDSKEVSKRSIRFVAAGLIVSSIMVPLNVYDDYYVSAINVFLFCVFLAAILFMLKKGYTRYTQTFVIIGINLFLTLFNFCDGLKMGSHLYFFPLLFALPFLISSKKAYGREVLLYFLFTISCFLINIFFCPQLSPFVNASEDEYFLYFRINGACAIILSTVFSYLGIYFEKKYSKELLQQKEKAEGAMKSRNKFLSQMGHELRTPMNGIIGSTNLLVKQKMLPEQAEYLNILKYCSNHMLELINDILDYNKIESGTLDIHLTPVNLRQLLQNVAMPFFNRFDEKGVELKVELDESLDEDLMLDEIRMIQILNNLISNALKFTDAGHVKLSVSCLLEDDDNLIAHFMVEDTGIGIAAKDFKKVFESFEQIYSAGTRKLQGTGLGLNIAQRLLQLMESKLELKSTPGEGSRFSFTISFQKTHTEKSKLSDLDTEDNDLSGIRILVAEDNLINMLIAKRMLQGWNVSLTTAVNGMEALKSLEDDAEYNLILMDLEMPLMDGYTAVREIKKLYPSIPVLAYTAALIDQEMYVNLKQTGFVDAVLKPCRPIELFSKIRQYAN